MKRNNIAMHLLSLFAIYLMIITGLSFNAKAARSAVIKETLISVDDPTFPAYDPNTGKGVIAKIIDKDGQPGGLKEFYVMPGVPTTTVPTSDTSNFKYIARILPKVDSTKHHRIFLKSEVESTGSDPIIHSYIHQWACFANNNWWCIRGYRRNKGIYSLLPDETKESITSYSISNVPSGYLWQRYQFGRWWRQWYDAWQRTWRYKPFVYFESKDYTFPSFSRQFSWWNAIGQEIVPGNTYSMSYKINNPGSKPLKMRVYQAWYSWWPNLYRYWSGWDRYELDIPAGASETTTLTRTLPSNKNYQLLGGYHYEYLYDPSTPNRFLPVYKGDWPRAGYEKNKFLYVWYIHPRTTIDEWGYPNVNIKFGLYNLKYYPLCPGRSWCYDYHETINPGDFEFAYYLYSRAERSWLVYDQREPLNLATNLGPYGNIRLEKNIILEPEHMKNWYYIQIRTIRKSDGRGIWYRGVWFKPQPIFSSLDPDNEIHLCPNLGVRRMYRRNQIYNINDFLVYANVDASITGDPSAALDYDEWVKLPAQGLATTFLAYNYDGSVPSSTQRKDLKIKISYTDWSYREISETKTFPIYIHKASDSQCQGFKDIIPLEFNFGDLVMNANSDVSITIANWGNLDTGSFNVDLYVDEKLYSTKTISIDKLSEKTVSFQFIPSNLMHTFKVVVDSNDNIDESSPNGADVAENNNYLIASDIDVKVYDANTPYLNAFDLNESNKRVDVFMANNGNTVDLIETSTLSKGLNNIYAFPIVLDILNGPFNESTFLESKIDQMLSSSLESLTSLTSADEESEGEGEILLADTYSHFPFLWNISSLPTSSYVVTSDSSTDDDIDLSNNLKTKEIEVCNSELNLSQEPLPFSFDVSDKSQILTIFWIITNNGIDTSIAKIEPSCPVNWECTTSQITPTTLLAGDSIYIIENVNLNSCPGNNNYTLTLDITYEDVYGLSCISEGKSTFSKVISTEIISQCLCETISEGEQGSCEHGETGCWDPVSNQCCGDEEDETWTYETERYIEDVLVTGTCYNGIWYEREEGGLTYYDIST